jgi:hypothetical protein
MVKLNQQKDEFENRVTNQYTGHERENEFDRERESEVQRCGVRWFLVRGGESFRSEMAAVIVNRG